MGRPGFPPAAAGLACALVFGSGLSGALAAAPEAGSDRGREIFLREWVAHDPRSHGGDGLGPMYNETSCVACHSLGGAGGGGPVGKNALILSASRNRGQAQGMGGGMGGMMGGISGTMPTPAQLNRNVRGGGGRAMGPDPGQAEKESLAKIHAGFGDGRSVVLHRQSTREGYLDWVFGLFGANGFDERSRLSMPAEPPRLDGKRTAVVRSDRNTKPDDRARNDRRSARRETDKDVTTLVVTERNTPALFGAGLIDAVPDKVIKDGAEAQPAQIRGRVRTLPNGGVGRFGWKAQTESLREFVYAACASEIGLEVPRHHQASTPEGLVVPAGYDLDRDDCEALVAYVATLPMPSRAGGSERLSDVAEGERLFKEVGCAGCHTPDLGPAKGLYSDLLLHSMNPDLSDSGGGGYGGRSFSPGDQFAATEREWRTPPLWGVRDSAPYLHDGRADTLEEAIALHGGDATIVAGKFAELPPWGRRQVVTFLKSLVAPGPGAPAVDPREAAPEPKPAWVEDAARGQRRKLRAGETFERRGRAADAVAVYREAILLNPGSAEADAALDRLAALTNGSNPKR